MEILYLRLVDMPPGVGSTFCTLTSLTAIVFVSDEETEMTKKIPASATSAATTETLIIFVLLAIIVFLLVVTSIL